MRLEEVLACPPQVLTPEQRAFYFEQGYLHLEDFVSSDWIARLRSASMRLVERSRPLTESNEMFVLDKGHCAEAPRLRRLNRAVGRIPAPGYGHHRWQGRTWGCPERC